LIAQIERFRCLLQVRECGRATPAVPTIPLKVKPRFRGVSHSYAFFVSLLLLLGLQLAAPSPRARVACVVYGISLSALLAVSAVLHRVTWTSVRAREWMGRLDHGMIGFLIAGTYTPFGLLAVSPPRSTQLLTVIWTGAVASGALHILRADTPKALSALLYVVLGWVGAVAAPQIVASVGLAPMALLAIGGVVYSLGALVYAFRKPDPRPQVFGYHEVFHAVVLVGAAIHYVAVCLLVAALRR
jgi:hemolysin III